MGIWAIISGEFGDLQFKVLLTTLTVVGTSILGLACGAFLESPRFQQSIYKFTPIAGIIFAILTALLSLWLIWQPDRSNSEKSLKFFFVFLILAFSLAQLSLLSMARLAKKFFWSLITAYIVIFVLDSIISAIIIFELESDDGLILRFIGVLSVAAASLTVMIPIFHRLSRSEFVDFKAPTARKIDVEISNLKTRIEQLEKQKEILKQAQEK